MKKYCGDTPESLATQATAVHILTFHKDLLKFGLFVITLAFQFPVELSQGQFFIAFSGIHAIPLPAHANLTANPEIIEKYLFKILYQRSSVNTDISRRFLFDPYFGKPLVFIKGINLPAFFGVGLFPVFHSAEAQKEIRKVFLKLRIEPLKSLLTGNMNFRHRYTSVATKSAVIKNAFPESPGIKHRHLFTKRHHRLSKLLLGLLLTASGFQLLVKLSESHLVISAAGVIALAILLVVADLAANAINGIEALLQVLDKSSAVNADISRIGILLNPYVGKSLVHIKTVNGAALAGGLLPVVHGAKSKTKIRKSLLKLGINGLEHLLPGNMNLCHIPSRDINTKNRG